MQDSKIPKLSKQEILVLNDRQFFETKQTVTEKASALFYLLEQELKTELKRHSIYIPEGVLNIDSKLSKGENYKGLPYLVLDYPRCFKNENTFAFRSMLWWGNYFTFTLQLSGMYLQHYNPKIFQNLNKINLRNSYISKGTNPWVHELNDESYLTIEQWQHENKDGSISNDLDYLKLVRKLELEKWNNAAKFGAETFNLFLNLLH